MATNITVLDGTKGVYRHGPTGFTVHDIRSVDEAIAFNGVLAIDATSGYWAWVAGEDLAIEVYGRSKVTLSALARVILEQEYALEYERISPYYWGKKGGSTYRGAINIGGIVTTTKTIGSDLRIFGIANNAQAGRGVSPERVASAHWIGSLEVNQHGFTLDSLLNQPYQTGAHELALLEPSGYDTGRHSHAFTPGAGVVGRLVIAVPTGTWGTWLAAFKANMPNHDQAEVQAKAIAAVDAFTANVLPHMYTQPVVRVPLILTSDGKAWLDSNPTASVVKMPASVVGNHGYYNPFMSPSLPDEDGWWITNPVILQPGIAHDQWGTAVDGLDADMGDTVATIASPTVSKLYTSVCSQLTSLGGVELHKILGGLYPRVDGTEIAVPTHSVLNRVFNHQHLEDDPPAVGGASPSAYDATLTTFYASKTFDHERYNWGHWWLAGQPLLAATVVLEAYITGKPLRGDAAVRAFSGHLCAPMRVKTSGPQFSPYQTANVLSSASTFFVHQHKALLG